LRDARRRWVDTAGSADVIFSGIGVLLLIGAAILYFARRRSAAKQAASLTWPTCTGAITESYVQKFRDKDRNENYMPRVKFAYQVDGRDHKSERVAWGGTPYSRLPTEANARVARYPAGAAVPVSYNPQKPSEAVLEPAATGGLSTMTWLWVGMAVIGVVFFATGFVVTD
jgi:hypothetical protein